MRFDVLNSRHFPSVNILAPNFVMVLIYTKQ